MMELDFEIDKLTQSLEETLTGEIFQTEVVPVAKFDLKTVTKRNGWNFDWKIEFAGTNKQVYKLVLQQKSEEIQGMLAIIVKSDHVFMNLIETAPHNYGKAKKYYGVLANLVAFACKLAFENGFDGCVSFESKTKLIPHYMKELGAKVLYGQHMEIDTLAAFQLVNRYYPDFFTK